MGTSREEIARAALLLARARHVTAFTGAGISVESGIPPFRGPEGLWSKVDPIVLDIDYFHRHPLESWKVIKEIFFDFFGKAQPNPAHFALAELERGGIVKAVITQNIDNLHQRAGSRTVYELHGNSRFLVCEKCGTRYPVEEVSLEELPPRCPRCGTVLKPDFVFFGEQLPELDYRRAIEETEVADVFLLVGTTGEIMPASTLPVLAKRHGATIVEVNVAPSNYTESITDIFIREKASVALPALVEAIQREKNGE
ncbi:MAG TPA: NAD-dependent deacylase [Bacteroidetes bacterium]|nr:NAD-dependent deacylase [Bacteroidota bacterium]